MLKLWKAQIERGETVDSINLFKTTIGDDEQERQENEKDVRKIMFTTR